jgi:hypothetical protein
MLSANRLIPPLHRHSHELDVWPRIKLAFNQHRIAERISVTHVGWMQHRMLAVGVCGVRRDGNEQKQEKCSSGTFHSSLGKWLKGRSILPVHANAK